MRIINILMYCYNNNTNIQLYEYFFKKASIEYLIINDELTNNTLADLYNDSPTYHLKNEPLELDLLIIDGLSEDQITHIQTFEKDHNLTSIKAMRTPNNNSWLFKDLCVELLSEHAYFQLRDNLYNMLQSNKQIEIDKTPALLWQAYEKAFYHAYECVNSNVSIDELNEAKFALEESYNAIIAL